MPSLPGSCTEHKPQLSGHEMRECVRNVPVYMGSSSRCFWSEGSLEDEAEDLPAGADRRGFFRGWSELWLDLDGVDACFFDRFTSRSSSSEPSIQA